MKAAKTIAEYYIQKWVEEHIETENNTLELEVRGREGVLSDRNGDALKLYYNQSTKKVYVKG